MIRSLYAALLHLHPRRFRQRFGEEMLAIFDEEKGTPKRLTFLLDAAASALRQHMLREPPISIAATESAMFQAIETGIPRKSAVLHGAAISIVLFTAATFALGRAGGSFPLLLIGAKHSRPNVLPVDRASIAEAAPTTEIKVPRSAANPTTDAYFEAIRVLGILDADRNRVLSTREIAAAPQRLTRIDSDGNGRLSAEECGFHIGASSLDIRLLKEARHRFMRLNPALAVLDFDRDTEISPAEILDSTRALKTLDKDLDGSLNPIELLPE